MDPEKYRKKIELAILQIIKQKLKSHEMEAKKARTIARSVLDSLPPHMPFDQIRSTVYKLKERFTELIPIAEEVTAEYEEEIQKKRLQSVTDLIRDGKIEEAKFVVEKQMPSN